jgi:hypothetical protein
MTDAGNYLIEVDPPGDAPAANRRTESRVVA